jgi:6-phosphogluconolactonase (cycloisomerase 2 family)
MAMNTATDGQARRHARAAATIATLAMGLAVAHATAASAAQYVYVARQDGNIAQYSVGTGGALTPLSPATFAAGGQELAIAITPDARHVYAADNANRKIDQLGVGPAGGLQQIGAPIGLAKPGDGAESMAVSPDGGSLYAVDSSSNQINEFTIGAGGILTPKSPPQITGPSLSSAQTIAVSPDGTSVYVGAVTLGAGMVSRYPVGAGGVLGNPTSSLGTDPDPSVGTSPESIAVSADGHSVYVAGGQLNSGQIGAVSQFTAGAGGSLSAKSPLTVSTGSTDGPRSLALSPDGRTLYLSSYLGAVTPFSVAADGTLTLGSRLSLSGVTGLGGIAINPDGDSLYSADVGFGGVHQLSIAQGGNLAIKTPVTLSSGALAYDVVVTPDQAPAAAFQATPAAPGAPTLFDASRSTASDGTPASYSWSFGDGAAATSAGPWIGHTYPAPGTYPVTLTVIDDEGCSTALVFTGRTALCNGGSPARINGSVVVAAPGSAGTAGPPPGSTPTAGPGRAPAGGGTPAPSKAAPVATILGLPATVRAAKLHSISGTASAGVARVQVGLLRVAGGAHAAARGPVCRYLGAGGHLMTIRAHKATCAAAHFLPARGTAHWRFVLPRRLAPGNYVVYARAIAAGGAIQEVHLSATGANVRRLRVR